ncbi:MAG: methylated-DNA--[protein]-cysteine S-methyltransferase [Candidatus Aminicenantes bacterium]|nr:methylated-DNA--[protein]-cysteine S-methyltransferase [Candidatus Aminicenantes bacterium]
MARTVYFDSPLGVLAIDGSERGVASVAFVERRPAGAAAPENGAPAPLLACRRQLDEYFRGVRTEFDLPLNLAGTPFQLEVWRRLRQVPFGATTTYGALAAAMHNFGAARAVGGANHRNPVSIVIPCHRVVGGGGSLVGYGGGLWRKERLLGHERSVLDQLKS